MHHFIMKSMKKEPEIFDFLAEKERALSMVLFEAVRRSGNEKLAVKLVDFGMKFKKHVIDVFKQRFIEVLYEEVNHGNIGIHMANDILKDLGYERDIR